MTVTVPPPAPETEEQRELEERVTELEALIEEARRRARRRRTAYAAAVVLSLAGALASMEIGGRGGTSLGRSVAEGSPGKAATTSSEGRWAPLHGPEGGYVAALAVDPRDPAIAYAGGWGVVFKTTNGGQKWRSVTTKQPWGRVTALAVDPTRTATVYVATERGVARTTNGGRSWSPVNAGLFGRETPERREHRLAEGFVRSMMVDSGRPSTAYAMTNRGLFRITDGGARWRRVAAPPPGRRPYRLVAAAIDPGRPGLVYASWMESRRPWNRVPPNLYKSADSGNTWQRVDVKGRHPSWYGSLAVDPHRAGTLYAQGDWGKGGLWKSDDDGATWRITGLARPYVTSHWVDPSPRATVFATTAKGTFTSSDGGVTWRRLGQGVLPGYSVVASHPLAPDTLYGSDRSGLVKSVDGGRTWRPINAGYVSTAVEALALAHGSSEALFAGSGGVQTSVDGGRSWRAAPNGLEGKWVISFAVASRPQGAVYAGTWGSGVFKSSDGGRSWKPVAGLPVEVVAALAVDPKRPDTVYAGARGRGVYQSVDGGATWSATTLRRANVRALAVDPLDPSTVFAGTTGGVFRSSDGGDSWQLVVTAASAGVPGDSGLGTPGTFQAVAIDPANPETVYAGMSSAGGILKSLDGGDTWARANAGRANPHVDALAVDPRDPSTLYAAGDAGVFRSTDGARSWHRFDRGLGGAGVKALAVPPDGRTVFAGTSGRGVVGLEPAG